MLVLEKQEKFQDGNQMFYAVVQLIGAKKESENFIYRFVALFSFQEQTHFRKSLILRANAYALLEKLTMLLSEENTHERVYDDAM